MYTRVKLTAVSLWVTVILAEAVLRTTKVVSTWSEKTGKGYYSLYGATVKNHYRLLRFNEQYKNCNTEFCYTHQLNKHGYVGAPPSIPKKKYRIITLGDSFTEGVGAQSPDSSIGALLQKHLAARGTEAEVCNFGNGGSDVVFEMKYLLDSVKQFSPDMVLMLYNSTDVTDMMQWGGEERFMPDGSAKARSGPWFAWWYQHSHLVRLLVANGLRYDSELLLSSTAYQQEKQLALTNSALAIVKAANFCKTNGIEFYLVLLPLPPQLTTGKSLAESEFKALCSKLCDQSISTVNLLDPMAKKINSKDESKYWWPKDGHYQHTGYLLAAQLIADSICSKQAVLTLR